MRKRVWQLIDVDGSSWATGIIRSRCTRRPIRLRRLPARFNRLRKLQAVLRAAGKVLTETDDTLDLLAEAGIEYVADWVLDEQPLSLKTRSGSIVSVPYTVEINDVVISAVQQQPSDEIYRRGRDHFDRLYLDGAKAPRIMAIAIHPYLTGVPHRIKYLEMLYDHILSHDDVLMWTGAEILDWYLGQTRADATTDDRQRQMKARSIAGRKV
jgi:hypothetical protein